MISEHAKRHSTVYQIQCETQNKGKRVASSKRRIRWRFGFANSDAIAEGQQGVDCRGAEHEVVFVWSLNSGKQLILADGQEVHWAKNSSQEKVQVAWDMFGNHKLKVAADRLQFDLFIDGIAFKDLPSIYQLGTTRDLPLPRSRSYSMPDLLKEEEEEQQTSPISSMDMIVFDHAVEVQLFHQPPPPPPPQPHYQRAHSANYPQTTTAPPPPPQPHYQRAHSANYPQTTPTTTAPVYTWNDYSSPQQYNHHHHHHHYRTQQRGSMSSYSSSASSNPFDGYSTPTRSVNYCYYDSDNNDSPLSSALRSLGG